MDSCPLHLGVKCRRATLQQITVSAVITTVLLHRTVASLSFYCSVCYSSTVFLTAEDMHPSSRDQDVAMPLLKQRQDSVMEMFMIKSNAFHALLAD
jgi:hypothetical protein